MAPWGWPALLPAVGCLCLGLLPRAGAQEDPIALCLKNNDAQQRRYAANEVANLKTLAQGQAFVALTAGDPGDESQKEFIREFTRVGLCLNKEVRIQPLGGGARLPFKDASELNSQFPAILNSATNPNDAVQQHLAKVNPGENIVLVFVGTTQKPPSDAPKLKAALLELTKKSQVVIVTKSNTPFYTNLQTPAQVVQFTGTKDVYGSVFKRLSEQVMGDAGDDGAVKSGSGKVWLWIVVVLAILLLGGGVYYWLRVRGSSGSEVAMGKTQTELPKFGTNLSNGSRDLQAPPVPERSMFALAEEGRKQESDDESAEGQEQKGLEQPPPMTAAERLAARKAQIVALRDEKNDDKSSSSDSSSSTTHSKVKSVKSAASAKSGAAAAKAAEDAAEGV